jgi:hypothetical protein
MKVLLLTIILGSPNVYKEPHEFGSMTMAECRMLAKRLTEPGRSYSRCALIPPEESHKQASREPRK